MLKERNFDAPVIHVVSESPRLEMLQARLRQAGMRPVPVRGQYLPPDSAPALIDQLTRQENLEGQQNRLVITIGKTSDEPNGSDIHLSDVGQIATLPARIAIRLRENQRQREIDLRARTAEKFGAPVSTAQSTERARLLWLGQDAPFLNAIKASLKACDVNLVAAISRLTAEDYLISGQFKTMVLCPSSQDDEAAKLLRRAKKLPQITAPRIVLLLRSEISGHLTAEDMANADQIVDLTSDTELVASRLHAICTSQNVVSEEAPRLTSQIQDSSSGLVTRAYLETHLQAQIEQADRLAMPLSLVSVTLSEQDDVRAIARKIKALLRDTDLAARLDANHICVTLPETTYRGAVILARRIEEALDTSIDWRAIERRRFHTLKSLLGGLTARSTLTTRKTA